MYIEVVMRSTIEVIILSNMNKMKLYFKPKE